MFHSTYKGASIYRNTEPGYKLRWTSLCFGRSYAADTLAGIKELISGDTGVWCVRRPRHRR
jgi:hypothetical protein